MKQARNTIAKTEILRLISSSGVALSHPEIQSSLGSLCDRVTIYRVLDRLVQENRIHKVVTIDGTVKYASCSNCTTAHNHDHIHFNCVKCLSVTCIRDVQPSFQLPANYQVNEVNFTVSGVCDRCG